MTTANNKAPLDRETLVDLLPWADRPVWRGVDCAAGWWPLVEAYALVARAKGWQVLQVKEKMGRLCLYTSGVSPSDVMVIEALESASREICEQCGHGNYTLQSPRLCRDAFGWLKTLCRPCADRSAYTYPETPNGRL